MGALLRLAFWVGGAVLGLAALERFLSQRRKIFVSYDYDEDRHYKQLLVAWNANRRFDFRFNDASSGEVQSSDVGRIKAALTRKIRDADLLLVIVGRFANRAHRDRRLIGTRNWLAFEISQAKAAKKPIVAVKIDREFEAPRELMNSKVSWAMSFTEAAVTKALREA